MNRIWAFLLLGLLSCKTVKQDEWKTMDLGEFKLTVPAGSKLKEEKSIDSYVAKIQGKGFELMFDYGAYSPKMTLSPKEYIQEKEWEKGSSTFAMLFPVIQPMPRLSEVTPLDDSTFVASYNAKECMESDSCIVNTERELFESFLTSKDSLLTYKFIIPKKQREFDFTITETDSIFKRTFIPKELNKYKAGTYILNKNSCEEDNPFHCLEQLALWTSDTVRISRSDLGRILKSVEFK